MAERSLEEEIMIKAQQVRRTAKYMASIEDLVEERIRKAREQGAFDNLKGSGKPLNLYENPFEPSDMRMAYKILKDAGYAPHWVELGKDVDAGLEALAEEVEKFKRYVMVVLDERMSPMARRRFERKKASFLDEIKMKLEKLHKQIDNYNNNCPMFWLGRTNIDVRKEYALIEAEVEAVIVRTVSGAGSLKRKR